METLNRAEEELKKTKLHNRTKATKKESAREVINETEADATVEAEEQVAEALDDSVMEES